MIVEESQKLDSKTDFDRAADSYDAHAKVQQEVADRLIASLDPWKDTLPPGPVLELGCGTGFVSRGLVDLFESRPLILSDASPRMLSVCREKLNGGANLKFEQLDGEEIPDEKQPYALTISSFVAQWFQNPGFTLGQWMQATKPGGLLLAAFPGSESFPEWKKHAADLGLPFTGNELPEIEEMVIKLSSEITQVDYYEDTINQKFDSAANFFRNLKTIGAGKQRKGRHLTPKEMKLLINHWDESVNGNVSVSWHVVFLAVKRNLG